MIMLSTIVRRRFAVLVEQDDPQIDLGYAALLVAHEEYPDLNVRLYLSRLDELARRVRERAVAARSLRDVVDAINEELFVVEGFCGNENSYHDPRNSFLNDVFDRKLGIPITLSVIYLEVGRRLGLPVEGIGLPGHFIVGVDADERLLIDPFNRGNVLTLADCSALVRQVYGERLPFHPRMLAPVTRRQILTRMLTNLKVIYAELGDSGRLLAAIDRLLLINPRELHEIRDRGLVCQRLKFNAQALADFRAYLEMAPHASDVEAIRQAMEDIRRELAPIN